MQRRIPLRLVCGVHLALDVVTDVANVRKASNVELGCSELRHDGRAALSPCAMVLRL